MKIFKGLSLVFLSLFLCLSMTIDVFARPHYGSIELAFENRKTCQMSFSVYKIGDLVEGSLVQYLPSLSFDGLKSDLNGLKTAKDCEVLIQECVNFIIDNKIEPTQTQIGDDNGNVYFKNLDLGLYLVKQDIPLDDFQAETVLIALPMNNDSSLVYDVVALPKYSHSPDIPKPDKPTISVVTGDDQDILPLVMTLGISCVFGLLLYVFIRKDRK